MQLKELSYVLPIRRTDRPAPADLTEYLRDLARDVEVIVVDGSPPALYDEHRAAWGGFAVHVPPAKRTTMGKVGGVVTGVARASCEKVVIADDDVRYDRDGLARMAALLDEFEVVRPQNYFDPSPWHASWDTGRTLLNRVIGGDWPGTMGVRKAVLDATGGYDGDAMFENLELVRTVIAAGGREAVPLDLYVRRDPCTSSHFWSQRVRQAYDELARPSRLLVSLAVLPTVVALALTGRWRPLLGGWAAIVATAEAGRRRARGTAVFPFTASLLAPAWVAERAVCIWLAAASRLRGGVRYGDGRVRLAATPLRELRRRYAGAYRAGMSASVSSESERMCG